MVTPGARREAVAHGRERVDDRRVLSGIIFVNRNGLRWRDALKDYGRTRRCTIGGSGGATKALPADDGRSGYA